ncbi:ABC transporter permease [Dyella terrae]|uniref:Transport permease protein n=3 Tax=Rhodanobacteraceae TaxID=1775411 RepID=A0A4V2NML7_9GAMM|nr:ABC transporter permease [Dyella terrae]TCI13787.1 ABC transporter permease [Dyella soli]
MPRSRVLRAYLEEARAECLRYLRSPGFLIPTMLLPTVFYLMFGIFLGRANGPDAPRYLLAAYGTFGVMAPGLFGFGLALAMERDNGLLTLKRALPMPPNAYLLGKMSMAMVVAACVAILLLSMATFLAHVPLTGAQMLALFFTDILGVLPFCAMGLWLGTLLKGQGAPSLVNLVYLPMSFLSGLWFPLNIMPRFIQEIAPIWPSYHLNRLALSAVGLGSTDGTLVRVIVLIGFTVAFVGLAARRLRRHG